MTGWRRVAEELRQGDESRDNRDNRDNRDKTPAPPVAHDPFAVVKQWRVDLAGLDGGRPTWGLDRLRWRELSGDAAWLLEHFGQQAAREGYSTLDLFGVLPGRDGWGGIACRLRGSRSLVMSGEVARWRRVVNGEPESFARGLGDTVQMVPLWEQGCGAKEAAP